MNYKYKAVITDVYDGDTVTATIDLGFGVFLHKQKLRLYGINAPEMRGEEKGRGKITRDYLSDKILNEEVEIQTFKDKKGKYGRWLAVIHYKGIDMNNELYEQGLAVRATY